MTKLGYKTTEIGEIPEEWACHAIGDPEISENTKAGGTPLRSKKEYYENGNIPFVKIADIVNSGKYLDNTADKINENGIKNSSSWITPPYSILFSMYASYGELTINKVPIATNQAILSIIPNKSNIDLEYFYYQLKFLKPRLVKYLRYTTQNNLNAGVVNSLIIPVAPLPEQQKIAEILSAADDEIQKVNEQIVLTEQLKKGLMQRLLTRGIGHTRFKMTEIGEIPEEWDVKKIRELRQNIYYGITAKATKENTNLRMLRTTDIKNFKFDLNNLPFCQITEKRSDLSKYFLKRNDIIIARAGTVGVSILVEENLNNVLFGSYLIKIIFKQETIDMPFIHYYFQSQLYWNNISNAQGSTIKNINLPFLNSLEIPLPPIPEQQKIAEILSTVDNKLELLGTKRDKLNVLKKGLMNDLLTGKVRVKV